MSLRIYYDVNGRNGERFEISGDLSKLKSGKGIFSSIGYITDFSYDLPLLVDAQLMFNKCYNLTTFTSNLSSLTKGSEMFQNCSNLTTFNADLSSLENGVRMFYYCSSLTTFNANLISLTKGGDMFVGCKKLSSFTSDLRSLTDGEYMFSGCTILSSFTSDLRSLTKGNRMFNNCKLNASSVENIANTINTYTGGQITIHVDATMSDEDKSLVLSYFNAISVKGWTVDSNLSTVATANEDGEIVESTMICAKVDESYNDYYTHLDNDGNKVILSTAKMVIGSRENEWTVFASLEDAEQFFGLTRIVDELNNNT